MGDWPSFVIFSWYRLFQVLVRKQRFVHLENLNIFQLFCNPKSKYERTDEARLQNAICFLFNFREIDQIKAQREQKKGNKEEVRMLKSILYQIS